MPDCFGKIQARAKGPWNFSGRPEKSLAHDTDHMVPQARVVIAAGHTLCVGHQRGSNSMRDGVELVADAARPRHVTQAATVLIRSCYGRGTLFAVLAKIFAECELQAVRQPSRR